MEGGLVGVGDVVFEAAEALCEGGEARPLGALECEKDFVEIAITVLAPAERGLYFGIDGQGLQDILDGLVEQRVGDGEESHQKHGVAFSAEAGGRGKILAEIGAGEGGVNQFRGLAGTHGDYGEDGNPTAKFPFAEQGDGVADAGDFGAQAERGRIEIAEQAVEQGRLLLEQVLDGSVVEVLSGDGAYELKLNELVAGNIARFKHRGLAEEVALEVAVSQIARLVEIALCFHFFRQQREAITKIFFGDALAAIGIEEGEVDFQVVREIDQRLKRRLAKKIVKSEGIAILAEFPADADDFVGGLHAFENFDDDAVGRKQPGRAEAKSEFIHVDESAGVAGEILQIKESERIGDDTGRSMIAGLEEILRAAAEEQFVGIYPQPLVKNGLAGNEFFMHTGTVARRGEPFLFEPR